MVDDRERVQIEYLTQWRSWLAQNYTRRDGIWLVTFKKHCGVKYVSHSDVIDEALCFGWIDNLPRKLDEDRTMHGLSPRKPGSGWSKRNKERVERMIAEGRMTTAGLEKVKAAQQDGSWNALDAIEAFEIPPDLDAALGKYPSARKHFDAFPRSVKRSILEWIANAKRTQTRAKRVEETARLAEDNIRANQWRQ